MPTHEELVGYFNRHMVLVHLTLSRGNDIQNTVITAFVLSIKSHWLLVTAGHCISRIQELVAKHGYRIARCFLIDSGGIDAIHTEPIPFNYENSHPTCLSTKGEYDYGVISLTKYYQDLLLKNNIQALNEDAWEKEPPQVDFYMLLGVPSQYLNVSEKFVAITAVLINIIALEERPEAFPETDVPLFYAKAILDNTITSIEGMSGGPIFGFFKNERNELRYWLIALQSTWLKNSHIIKACPTRLLGLFLKRMINEYERKPSN